MGRSRGLTADIAFPREIRPSARVVSRVAPLPWATGTGPFRFDRRPFERVETGNADMRVAVQWPISGDTVNAHMKSILPKPEANDRTHAVAIPPKRGSADA